MAYKSGRGGRSRWLDSYDPAGWTAMFGGWRRVLLALCPAVGKWEMDASLYTSLRLFIHSDRSSDHSSCLAACRGGG